jgi:Ser/Thr protein kinase RdoA (MazF antagonist)
LEQARDQLIHSLDPITRDLESFLVDQSQWIETQFGHLDVALQKADLPRQLIHGDYGPYNLLVKPGEPLAVIDFELAHLDWRLIDLVAAVSSTTNKINSKPNLGQMKQIVKGYQSVNPVDADEISLIPFVWQFKMLRRVITLMDNYLADGKIKRLKEARHRIEKLDWIIRYENELRKLGQD